jgi:hypothetical protein
VTTPHGHDDDLPTAEVDARFADIVAGFATPATDPVPRWSALEDVDDAPETEPVVPDEPVRPPLSSRLLRSEPTPPEPPIDPLDIEEHFVPEPPPPLPEVDRFTRLAWAALVGGPALLVIAMLLGIGLEAWVVVVALLAFVGGFGMLVMRMHEHRDDDDDDGAVI